MGGQCRSIEAAPCDHVILQPDFSHPLQDSILPFFCEEQADAMIDSSFAPDNEDHASNGTAELKYSRHTTGFPRASSEGPGRVQRSKSFQLGKRELSRSATPEAHSGQNLPRNNPYVGSFHRGATKSKIAKARSKKPPANVDCENFVQQFLPLGMMTAALSRSLRMRRKGEPRDAPTKSPSIQDKSNGIRQD